MRPAITCPPRPCAAPAAGFTLVEVMVALVIMAVLATMAWQGVDGMARAREGAQRSGAAALRLSTALAQWEQDLQQIQQSSAAPGLKFDGASLRLTRRGPGGIQMVVWTLQDGTWYRWAGPSVTRIQDLQDWWIRSQQWAAIRPDALRMLEQVQAQQVYFFRGNSWSNAQSTGDFGPAPGAPQPPAGGEGGEGDGNEAGQGGGNGNQAGGKASRPRVGGDNELLPTGVRVVLTLPGGRLTRDVMVTPSQ